MKATARQLALCAVIIFGVLIATGVVRSHCQVPCGIYDDHKRIDMIAENITTIEKCINSIRTLSDQNPQNMNQIVRWVNTKEAHADDTADIITHYFMSQRLKFVDASNENEYDKYVMKLRCLHQMLIYSMRAKQSADMANAAKLRELLGSFEKMYFAVDAAP